MDWLFSLLLTVHILVALGIIGLVINALLLLSACTLLLLGLIMTAGMLGT